MEAWGKKQDRKVGLNATVVVAVMILSVVSSVPAAFMAASIVSVSPAQGGPVASHPSAAPEPGSAASSLGTGGAVGLGSSSGASLGQTALGSSSPAPAAPAPADSSPTNQSNSSANPPTQTGCYTLTAGNSSWVSSPCAAPLDEPMVPAPADSTFYVGNIDDYIANYSTPVISRVEGSFPTIDGLLSETCGAAPAFPTATCVGGDGANGYTLQINSQVFYTDSAYTAGGYWKAWEQYVYLNPTGGGSGTVEIEYWLFGWLNSHASCPTSTTTGLGSWGQAGKGSPDCTAFSNGASTPNFPATEIANETFYAYANYKGSGNDEVEFCHKGTCYSMSIADNVLNLYEHWYESEFNVFGGANGSLASFNAGTSILVLQAISDSSGNPISPDAYAINGTTGETNNLYLGPAATFTSSGIEFPEASEIYTLASSPSSVTILAGRTATYPLTVTLTEGTAAPVGLSVVSGLPAGTSPAFSVNPVTPTGTSTFTISTPVSVALGDYTIVIQAQFGVLDIDLSVTLHIYDFTVNISPSSETVLRGTTAVYYPLTLVLLPGSSTTNLPAETLTVSGLPSTASYVLSASTETPTFAGCSISTLQDCQSLTVFTAGPPSGSLGNFPFSVKATDPDPSGGSRTGTASLHIFDFSVIVTPISRTTLRGTVTSYAVTLKLVSGSSTTGIPSIALSVSGLPSDAIFVLAASSLTPTLSGSTTTLTVTTAGPPSGSLGNFPFTVTGTNPSSNGGGSRIGSPYLRIFDFTVTLAPVSETLTDGGTVAMTVSLALVPGSTTIGLPSISMSLLGLPSGIIAVGFPSSMTIGTTDAFTVETSTVASYVNCPQVVNGGGQILGGADLAHCNLAGYDLQGDILIDANLFGANLKGASLADADLEFADLASANLDGTNFAGANLQGVDLTSAFPLGVFTLTAVGSVDGGSRTSNPSSLTVLAALLSGDDFDGANLQYANLTSDVLTGAPGQFTNFDWADLQYTNLTNAVCGSPNYIIADAADTQNEINVPASCNPPLGIALGASVVFASPLSSGIESPLILLPLVVGALVVLALSMRRRPRRPQSGTRATSPPMQPSGPRDGGTERVLEDEAARSTQTQAPRCAEDVFRKARAAEAALVAQGKFESARKIRETADRLRQLKGSPKEWRDTDTMYR